MFIHSLVALTLTVSSLIAAPQAIVFDFGGVLTGESNREAVVSFLRESFHLSQEEFEIVNREKHLAFKQGKTDEEFWLSYAQSQGIELPLHWATSLKSVMKEAINVNPQMYLLLEQLRDQRIRVALLSNVDERLAKLIREFGLYESFHPCLLSCEIGVDKPDPRAYEVLLKQLNVQPSEVVFIDDRLEAVLKPNFLV